MHSTASFTSCTLKILAPFCNAIVLSTVVPLRAWSTVDNSDLWFLQTQIQDQQ